MYFNTNLFGKLTIYTYPFLLLFFLFYLFVVAKIVGEHTKDAASGGKSGTSVSGGHHGEIMVMKLREILAEIDPHAPSATLDSYLSIGLGVSEKNVKWDQFVGKFLVDFVFWFSFCTHIEITNIFFFFCFNYLVQLLGLSLCCWSIVESFYDRSGSIFKKIKKKIISSISNLGTKCQS